jgi:hypothetical protein
MQEFINFDWMNYLNYYSELRKSGINTKVKAWNHWLLIGKKEGYIFFELELELEKIQPKG